MGWQLLYQAKKISRKLSLLLSVVGMVIIGLICLGQSWIHFHVPLTAPGDPAGPRNIPIDTIFFVRCRDISCLYEYDRNACKACPRVTFPGIHLSSVLGTPSCLPLGGPDCPGVCPLISAMVLTTLGSSSLPQNGPHCPRTILTALCSSSPTCYPSFPQICWTLPGPSSSLPASPASAFS